MTPNTHDTTTAKWANACPTCGHHRRPVTLRPKRYIVSVCASCDLLFHTARKNQITCSTACRVRYHRDVEARGLMERLQKGHHGTPADILRAAAIDRLRPDLGDKVIAGSLTLADVAPQVWDAYMALVRQKAAA